MISGVGLKSNSKPGSSTALVPLQGKMQGCVPTLEGTGPASAGNLARQTCVRGLGLLWAGGGGGASLTSLEVTFSRSWLIMMLRSLALMRRSVLSPSVGLGRKHTESCRTEKEISDRRQTLTGLTSATVGVCTVFGEVPHKSPAWKESRPVGRGLAPHTGHML